MLLKRFYTPAATAVETNPAETFEYILLDRQRPDGSHNLSREFGLTNESLIMRDNKPERYYAHNEATDELFSIGLDQPELKLEISGVIEFKDHDAERILYVTTEGAEEDQARVMLREGDTTYFIRAISRSEVYLLDMARYDGSWYVVAGSQADNRVYLFENPVQSIRSTNGGRAVSTFSFPVDTPSHVSFSGNAQFVLVQNKQSARVFDSENNQAYRYDLPYEVDGPEEFATWMDGHRLSYVSSGNQIMFDYDNVNAQQLVASDAQFGGFYDRDTRYLYTLTRSTDTATAPWQLMSTPLLTEADL